MPFNIEVSIQPTFSIKLQVVKNTISVYFNGEEWAAERAAKAWTHLESHFLSSMPHYNNNWVRGPDAPHIKRNHTSDYEVPIMHFHREFHTEITPVILANYLIQILKQQYLYPEREYQFLDTQCVKEVDYAFGIYFAQYKGSIDEQIFEEEHVLTEEEQMLYEKAVNEQHQPEELLLMLLSNSIFARKPPMITHMLKEMGVPIMTNKKREDVAERLMAENCVIM